MVYSAKKKVYIYIYIFRVQLGNKNNGKLPNGLHLGSFRVLSGESLEHFFAVCHMSHLSSKNIFSRSPDQCFLLNEVVILIFAK